MDPSTLVLGLDIGGTSSRALVCDARGEVHGTGTAEGGNPNSHPLESAVRQISTATRAALAQVDPAAVRAATIGLAGSTVLTDPETAEHFRLTWHELGLRCPITVLADYEVAFAAGTPVGTGAVLIAGTGAVAARVEEHRAVHTAGGYGWLLGDDGSGFWIGREAVRTTLRTLDAGSSLTGLSAAVLTELLGDARPHRHGELISAVHAAPPIRLAELAPLVTANAADDPAARRIVHRAASALAETVRDVHASEGTELVLAGGLVDERNPVGTALRTELRARGWPTPRLATAGAAGAAWLAARDSTAHDTSTGRLTEAGLVSLHGSLCGG